MTEECHNCDGDGLVLKLGSCADRDIEIDCPVCQGTGYAPVYY